MDQTVPEQDDVLDWRRVSRRCTGVLWAASVAVSLGKEFWLT